MRGGWDLVVLVKLYQLFNNHVNIVQSLLYIDCQSADSLVDVGLRSLAIVMAAEDEVLDSKIKFWDLGGAQLVECELFGTLPVFGVDFLIAGTFRGRQNGRDPAEGPKSHFVRLSHVCT